MFFRSCLFLMILYDLILTVITLPVGLFWSAPQRSVSRWFVATTMCSAPTASKCGWRRAVSVPPVGWPSPQKTPAEKSLVMSAHLCHILLFLIFKAAELSFMWDDVWLNVYMFTGATTDCESSESDAVKRRLRKTRGELLLREYEVLLVKHPMKWFDEHNVLLIFPV